MKTPKNKMVRELRLFWKNYVFQSLLATLVIFIVLLSLSIRDDAAIIASIGATTFIVFTMPDYITAKPRNVIGGHIVGLACGSLSALVPHPASPVAFALLCALAVGLSMFIMVVTDTEHAPAAGTALGVAIKGLSLNVTIAVLASAVILSLIRHLAKHRLRDLT